MGEEIRESANFKTEKASTQANQCMILRSIAGNMSVHVLIGDRLLVPNQNTTVCHISLLHVCTLYVWLKTDFCCLNYSVRFYFTKTVEESSSADCVMFVFFQMESAIKELALRLASNCTSDAKRKISRLV